MVMVNLWKQGRNSVCQILDSCWSEQGKINGTEFEVLFDTPSQGLKNAECKWVVRWKLERPGKLVQWMIEVVLAEDVGCILPGSPCPILVGGHGLSPETKTMCITNCLKVWQSQAIQFSWNTCRLKIQEMSPIPNKFGDALLCLLDCIGRRD